MAKRIKNTVSEESLFVAATLKDSRFIEEHCKSFLQELGREKVDAKNNIQSELNVGLGKVKDKADVLLITIKLTINIVEAADESKKIAEYVSVLRQVYDVAKIYGHIDEVSIPVSAVQPYVHLALTVSASRAKDTLTRFGMAGISIPVSTEFSPLKA